MGMHPYRNLAPNAFWRTAVSDKNFLELEDVYAPKFPITPTDRIVTAGSCFAQHIARKLSDSGLAYRDFEAAPPDLPSRYAATSTTASSRRATAPCIPCASCCSFWSAPSRTRHPAEDVWMQDGRWFDPYRPAIEPARFASEEVICEEERLELFIA